MNILEKYLKNIKKFWVKFLERFRLISGENFEEKLKKKLKPIVKEFRGKFEQQFIKNFA